MRNHWAVKSHFQSLTHYSIVISWSRNITGSWKSLPIAISLFKITVIQNELSLFHRWMTNHVLAHLYSPPWKLIESTAGGILYVVQVLVFWMWDNETAQCIRSMFLTCPKLTAWVICRWEEPNLICLSIHGMKRCLCNRPAAVSCCKREEWWLLRYRQLKAEGVCVCVCVCVCLCVCVCVCVCVCDKKLSRTHTARSRRQEIWYGPVQKANSSSNTVKKCLQKFMILLLWKM